MSSTPEDPRQSLQPIHEKLDALLDIANRAPCQGRDLAAGAIFNRTTTAVSVPNAPGNAPGNAPAGETVFEICVLVSVGNVPVYRIVDSTTLRLLTDAYPKNPLALLASWLRNTETRFANMPKRHRIAYALTHGWPLPPGPAAHTIAYRPPFDLDDLAMALESPGALITLAVDAFADLADAP